mgnify:CR=1 FL=1
MAKAYSLDGMPPGYPVGYVYAPDVFNHGEEFQHCSIQGCSDKPAYEIYHGPWTSEHEVPPGFTKGWWFVCRGHKKWLVENSKKEAVVEQA